MHLVLASLRRLSLQDRIFAGIAVMLALMVTMFVVDTASARAQAALSARIITRLIPTRVLLRSAERWIVRADDDGAWHILAMGSPAARGFLRQYRADVNRVGAQMRDAQQLSDVPQKDALTAEFDRRWAQYRQNNEDAFLLAAGGRVPEARAKYVAVSYQPLLEVLGRYEGAVRSEIQRTQANYDATRARTQTFGLIINVAALLLGLLVAVRLGASLRRHLGTVTRAISDVVHDDLAHVTASFRNVARGDFNAPAYVCTRTTIAESGGRELAALAASYNRLIGGLAEMANRIEDAAADARRRQQAEERLSYVLYHDEATGLPNRELLCKHLDSRLARGADGDAPLAVAYIKLEGFKKIGDSFGHATAIDLIRSAGERLAKTLQPGDTLGRDGVDEFVVLLDGVGDGAGAAARVASMVDAISKPFNLADREVSVSAVAGLSVFPGDGRNGDELLRNADTAMDFTADVRHAKLSVYDDTMRTQSLQRLAIETDLQRALSTGEFQLDYQPVVNVQRRRITGFEALLRWHHPRLGTLAPSAFLDVAEQTGIIEPLGAWVLQTACAQVQQWRSSGYDVRLAVNVSMRQLHEGTLFRIVSDALRASGLAPGALELEFTESMILKERETAASTLAALRDAGVRFAIDDFGTGYSWYGYLRYFVPHTLKIDRSFIVNVAQNRFDEAIANAMIMLGHSLQLNVVAEGVESTEQMLTLHKLQCDEMQGFLFAKPATARECERMLREKIP
ncbi:MAG TPA: bifunctional diguanylate cyclase/phosphodiesterase [Candidatus Baltobacteraceae bacterium]|nr:bifunctional diguanylate cyclase/phosphodiesterase [Candidatus Baltobacteraceae bacterium]